MKLLVSPTSPFTRKVRVVVRELGLESKVEEVDVPLRDETSPLLRYSPLAKVPALEIEPGLVLCESGRIVDYLDESTGRLHLLPADGRARLDSLALEGMASGFMDAVGMRSRYLRAEPQHRSPLLVGFEEGRCRRALPWFGERLAMIERAGLLPRITLACVLAFVEYRFDDPWRDEQPELARWYDDFAARPSMKATAPPAG